MKKKFRVDKEQFDLERDRAFLSKDEGTIRRFAEKHELEKIANAKGKEFWAIVHYGITGSVNLPLTMRFESLLWLRSHGMNFFDPDGKLNELLKQRMVINAKKT